MAELADALDLGSSVPDVKVQVLSGAPNKTDYFDRIVSLFFLSKTVEKPQYSGFSLLHSSFWNKKCATTVGNP